MIKFQLEPESPKQHQHCPFEVGEIAVFTSQYRNEVYLARIEPEHLEHWGQEWQPHIAKATPDEKALWYHSEEDEVILRTF